MFISFPRSAWERTGPTLRVASPRNDVAPTQGRRAAGWAFPRGAWERDGVKSGIRSVIERIQQHVQPDPRRVLPGVAAALDGLVLLESAAQVVG